MSAYRQPHTQVTFTAAGRSHNIGRPTHLEVQEIVRVAVESAALGEIVVRHWESWLGGKRRLAGLHTIPVAK